FFKVLPSKMTSEMAFRLAAERSRIIDIKSSFFKLILDILIFVYISDENIPSNTLNCLGNFYTINKKIFENVHEINIYLDRASGEYIRPHKVGFLAWLPLKRLLKEIDLKLTLIMSNS
ncbi:MAG: hypothetical protein ACFFBD_07480, partial [Candidatus Hodarchaeota archaeon]